MSDETNNTSEEFELKFDAAALLKVVGPLIASAGVSALVGAVMEKLKTLTATNSHKYTVAGDVNTQPTKEDTALAENEADGSKTKSTMANDDVNIQEGEVEASGTEAKASHAEASASAEGAVASRVKAGASDIETKGMKMM